MTEKQPTNKKKNFFSEWLETLQQESWQLELLISGLALFGIWQSSALLHRVDYYLDVHLPTEYFFAANIFVAMLWAGWYIFLINLLVHIIIRGFWIGAIGLRYVSGDVDYEALNYSDRFTNYFKKRHGSFDDYIERLEKISSVLFSFTFLLFFILLSFVMYLLVFSLFASVVSRFFPGSEGQPSGVSMIFGFLYFGIGMLVMADFFTLGAFKKMEERYIATPFYYIYRFYELVSLSFIYRPLLLNFIDNRYTKRLFFLAIPYVIILLAIQGFSLEKFSYFPSMSEDESYHSINTSESINWKYYDDLRESHLNALQLSSDDLKKEKINYVSIEKFENSGNYLRCFIEYTQRDNRYLRTHLPEYSAFRKPGLGHRLLHTSIPDSNLLAITKEEVHEREVLRKIISNKADVNESDSLLYKRYKDIQKEDLKKVRADISKRYKLKKQKYQSNKLQRIKSTLLQAYDFSIDDHSLVTDMQCDFFIHDNMHERGLLCYFNIDSLDYGLHYINLVKRKVDSDCVDECIEVEFKLPFRKKVHHE